MNAYIAIAITRYYSAVLYCTLFLWVCVPTNIEKIMVQQFFCERCKNFCILQVKFCESNSKSWSITCLLQLCRIASQKMLEMAPKLALIDACSFHIFSLQAGSQNEKMHMVWCTSHNFKPSSFIWCKRKKK